MMVLTNHISFVYDTFYFYQVSLYSMMNLTMMGLGPGHLVLALFNFALVIPLVVSLA